MSHTPGPWSVHSKFVGPLAVEADDVTVAHVGHKDWDTCAANAELIAASPDLLAALERAIPEIAVVGIPDLLEQARAAIKKARGEQ